MLRKRIDGHFWLFSRTRKNFSTLPTLNFSLDKTGLHWVSWLFLKKSWQGPLLGWVFLLFRLMRSVVRGREHRERGILLEGRKWGLDVARQPKFLPQSHSSIMTLVISVPLWLKPVWIPEIHDHGQWSRSNVIPISSQLLLLRDCGHPKCKWT